MKGQYNKTILPRLLTREMASKKYEQIRATVIKDARGTVLEIGSGPGYNFSHYREITKLYALEPSAELTRISKTRATSLPFPVDFINASAERIPLPDHWIDTVVSTWTLCSVTDLDATISEVSRVLKPNGKFIFVDHGAAPKKQIYFWQKLLTPISKHFTGNCHLDRDIMGALTKQFSLQTLTHARETGKLLIYTYQGVATKRSDGEKPKI